MDRLNFDMELKFAKSGPEGTFEGYGSVFNVEDLGGDVIMPSAFKASLQDWKAKGKLPKMLLQHGGMWGAVQDMLPIGRWTKMAEDSKGLQVEGQLIALDTDLGKRIYAAMAEGELDGLSIGYRAKEFVYGTKPGEPYRTLKQVDLREVSVVLFGMNEQALVSGVKQLNQLTIKDWRDIEAVFRDGGLSRADAVKAVSCFKNWLQRDAAGPGTSPRDEGASAELVGLLAGVADRIRAL